MFWETFYELCKLNKTTPTALCLKLGLSNAVATKWKKGSSLPNSETLIKIADSLNCSIDYLLGRTQNSNEFYTEYNQLNDEGKAKAKEYINDLLDNSKYTKKDITISDSIFQEVAQTLRKDIPTK